MDFLFEDYEIKEGLTNFLHDRFDPSAVEDYINSITNQEYNMVLEPSSVYNLIFVTSKIEHNFSSNELGWLKEIGSVMAYNISEITFYFVEMNNTLEEQYINCAVFIKIVDFLFPGNNCFIFKFESSISFGCPHYSALNNYVFDFALSIEFSIENLEKYVEFIEELTEYGIETISNYLYDEEENYDYEKVKYSRDDISFLYEIHSFYGLDVSKQLAENEYTNKTDKNVSRKLLHSCASKILDKVNIDEEVSSYDILEQATKAKEKADSDRTIQSKKFLSFEAQSDFVYSEEAFSNAEVMLKEMME